VRIRSGDVIWNPLTGEKALVVESAEETRGARTTAVFAVEEGGFVPGGEHVHNHLAERFQVQQGRITFLVDGEERTLEAGDEFTVQPGVWHRWWNSGEGEVRARVVVEPALRLEEALAVFWGLCADGQTDSQGRPSPLLGALFALRYRAEIRFREPPQIVQGLLFPLLAALARRRGLERVLDRYLDPDAHPSVELGAGSLPERIMRRP
jgi:quercetin dioxygenase-like cupin family protein